MIITELKTNPICYDGGLADGDIGKGTCMNNNRLTFYGLHKIRIQGLDHPSSHCTCNLKVFCCYRFSALIIGNNDPSHSFSHILKVCCDSKDRHYLRRNCNCKTRAHHESVILATESHNYIPQRLGTEIHYPFHFHIAGVDAESFQFTLCKLLVIIIELML